MARAQRATRGRLRGVAILPALLAAALLGSCARPPISPAAAPSCASCEQARMTNGWCDACAVGHVAGLAVPSAMLFEALDAHGHEIKPETMSCESCRAAVRSDGYCEACELGFVGGELYFSRLTYSLARGENRDRSRLDCKTCLGHSRESGWCERCAIGWVGNAAFANRRWMEEAALEQRRLIASVNKLEECETCAVAMFYGARCPRCGISYGRER